MLRDNLDATIAGIATAPGRGGVGLIRVSGSLSRQIFRKIFRSFSGAIIEQPQHGKLYFGHIEYEDQLIDEGYGVLILAPNSFTGEDTIEFSVHGSPVILNRIMKILLTEGCQQSLPGE